MTKVQITLTDEEVSALTSYGGQFGYSLPKTLRFVIGKAVESHIQRSTPVFPLNQKQEELGLRALREHREGQSLSFEEMMSAL